MHKVCINVIDMQLYAEYAIKTLYICSMNKNSSYICAIKYKKT